MKRIMGFITMVAMLGNVMLTGCSDADTAEKIASKASRSKENVVEAHAQAIWTGDGELFLDLLPEEIVDKMEQAQYLDREQLAEQIEQDLPFGNTVVEDVDIVEEDEQNLQNFNEWLVNYGCSFADEAYRINYEVTIGQELADEDYEGDTRVTSEAYVFEIDGDWYAMSEWVESIMDPPEYEY